MNVLVRVLGFEEQQLRDNEVRHVILDRADDKDHALLEEAGVDIIGTLAAGSLLHDHGNQADVTDILRPVGDLVTHLLLLLLSSCQASSWKVDCWSTTLT
jgi:hypothetical protein